MLYMRERRRTWK